MEIPKKFYKHGSAGYPVVCKTTGDLKKALKKLPDDLSVDEDFRVISVVNVNKPEWGTRLFFSDEESE